jgi:hypothetical protein
MDIKPGPRQQIIIGKVTRGNLLRVWHMVMVPLFLGMEGDIRGNFKRINFMERGQRIIRKSMNGFAMKETFFKVYQKKQVLLFLEKEVDMKGNLKMVCFMKEESGCITKAINGLFMKGTL